MPVIQATAGTVDVEVARLEKAGHTVLSITPGAPHGNVWVLYQSKPRQPRKRPDQQVETRSKGKK